MEKASDYKNLIKKNTPRSPVIKNSLRAFLFGGGISLIGELFSSLFRALGTDTEVSYTLASVTLIFLAALLTGLGVFDKIAKFAGAGTLVPVTGFANAVVSPAIDTKAEGLVVGVGSKIFTVAGPVILFAVLFGTLYGVIYFIITLL